jgi:hypothetical protein
LQRRKAKAAKTKERKRDAVVLCVPRKAAKAIADASADARQKGPKTIESWALPACRTGWAYYPASVSTLELFNGLGKIKSISHVLISRNPLKGQ